MFELPSTPDPEEPLQSVDLDLFKASSPALLRLIDEVRNAAPEFARTTAYNRTYHRHNR